MLEQNPPAPADRSHAAVIPLPIALYVSGELIFELYDGGQPCRKFSIRWERFVPAKEKPPEGAPQTVLHTRQD
jgi:hypothetical protein